MRQLRIREPWADMVHVSSEEAVEDLLIRVQVLEQRIRDLEAMFQVSKKAKAIEKAEAIEKEPAGV